MTTLLAIYRTYDETIPQPDYATGQRMAAPAYCNMLVSRDGSCFYVSRGEHYEAACELGYEGVTSIISEGYVRVGVAFNGNVNIDTCGTISQSQWTVLFDMLSLVPESVRYSVEYCLTTEVE